MKEIFKILIALVAILCSFWAGKHIGKSENESKITELENKIKSYEANSEKINENQLK